MMRLSAHPTRLRALLAAGAAVTAFTLAPAAARGSSVSVALGQLTYAGAGSESNRVAMTPWGFYLKVTETGTTAGVPNTLSVGSGCWRLSSSSAACMKGSSGIAFEGGEGDDYLDASLVDVPVSASGGAGNDVLNGGAGDDTFSIRDDAADSLTCGGGTDGGSGDSMDVRAADCEALELPETPVDPGTTDPGTTDPGTTDPGTTDPGTKDPGKSDPDPGKSDPSDPDDPADPPAGNGNAVPPSIPAQTVGISASGVASVLVACPIDSGGCKGTVALELAQAAKKPRRASKLVHSSRRASSLRLGRAKFKARAGTTKTVRVRLSKRGRQRILRSRRGRRARIVVTTRSADGKASIVTQEVTLRLRPRASGGKAPRR